MYSNLPTSSTMRRVCGCVLLILVGTCMAQDGPSRVVNTLQGPVRGYKQPTGDFYAFYSIPYATAPTGPHRFKEPLPPPNWTDTFEALDKNIMCPQNEQIFLEYLPDKKDKIRIEEDCLILNLYVPDTEETDLPVVVYVHGGAFQGGFSNAFTYTSLIGTGKMIIVNFNYRLGPHGFLCLGTEDVPGNAGMKDMVAALRWVKRNIGNFGGDPGQITVAGFSAGAAAAELLLLSKSSRGLFNKVILESGPGVGVWAIQSDPLEVAQSYALSLGFDATGDVYDLENYFKSLTLDVLQSSYSYIHRRDSSFYFGSCVEREEAREPFLVTDPVNIIKNGDYPKLPVLTGCADMEGIFRLPVFEEWKDQMNENFSEFLPADLNFANDNERRDAAEKIKDVYFGNRSIDEKTIVGYVNYFSDVMFAYPMYRSVSLQAAAGSRSLYLYIYAFVENRTWIPYADVTGAGHCDQSAMLGAPLITGVTETDNMKEMKRLLTDVWKNFIITGKPTPEGSLAAGVFGGEWQPAGVGQSRHALFNATSELRAALWPERVALWDDIYSRHYRTPVPPPQPPPKRLKNEL